MEQQKDSATLGMWAFLITEVLFFGGCSVSTSCIERNIRMRGPQDHTISMSNWVRSILRFLFSAV